MTLARRQLLKSLVRGDQEIVTTQHEQYSHHESIRHAPARSGSSRGLRKSRFGRQHRHIRSRTLAFQPES
jgi:hypothetical protein